MLNSVRDDAVRQAELILDDAFRRIKLLSSEGVNISVCLSTDFTCSRRVDFDGVEIPSDLRTNPLISETSSVKL